MNLRIAHARHWRYDWVEALPADVYGVLLEELQREHEEHERLNHGRDHR